jgi:hypothetical protein
MANATWDGLTPAVFSLLTPQNSNVPGLRLARLPVAAHLEIDPRTLSRLGAHRQRLDVEKNVVAPPSGLMKPKPRSAMYFLTIPCGIPEPSFRSRIPQTLYDYAGMCSAGCLLRWLARPTQAAVEKWRYCRYRD